RHKIRSCVSPTLMPLEILHSAFVFFGGRARFAGAEIAALASLRIQRAGIEPVFARLQFTDHGHCPRVTEVPISTAIGRLLFLPGMLSPSAKQGAPLAVDVVTCPRSRLQPGLAQR